MTRASAFARCRSARRWSRASSPTTICDTGPGRRQPAVAVHPLTLSRGNRMSLSGIFAQIVALIGTGALRWRRLQGVPPRSRLGQRPHRAGSEAAGGDPHAQDADRSRMGEGAAAGGGRRPQGQCVCDRPGTSALDRSAAQWRCAYRRVHADPRASQERVRLCDASDDAARRCARRFRQPHHAVARQGPRRRRRGAQDFHGGTEPAVRYGALGRHFLCRQHRRRRGFPLRRGRGQHHGTRTQTRQLQAGRALDTQPAAEP